MDQVVGGGADARVDEVAEHEEIGGEEEDGEEEPACVEVLVGEEGEEEEGGFFEVEEDRWAGQHELFIRDWLGMVRSRSRVASCKLSFLQFLDIGFRRLACRTIACKQREKA